MTRPRHSAESSGQNLARQYSAHVIEPLLNERFPGLPYAVGRLGSGSDVLGLDDATSRDHDWGLRLNLLVPPTAVDEVERMLAHDLPAEFDGHPTTFGTTWQPEPHIGVEVKTAAHFAWSRLGVDASHPLDLVEWLSLTGQSVLEVTAGPVFTDTAGELTAIRERLIWYPDELWRHALAADWARIGQELPFIGRAGDRGDDVGSRIIAARLVRTAMHLGFLLERRWPPYAKWLGTVFASLPVAGGVAGLLRHSLNVSDWREREAALCEALEALASLQRSRKLPTPENVVAPFFERPFRSLTGLPEALVDSIDDARIRALPLIGTIEQWSDSVPLLMDAGARVRAVASVLPAPATAAPTAQSRSARSGRRSAHGEHGTFR